MTFFRWVNYITFYSYCLFLVLIGVHGSLLPAWSIVPWEVYAADIFPADFTSMVESSALNQYRYMKTFEFGIGLFGLIFHKEIYSIGKVNSFFLVMLALGPAARLLSIRIDGIPHLFYLAIAGLELFTFLIVFAYSRYTLKSQLT